MDQSTTEKDRRPASMVMVVHRTTATNLVYCILRPSRDADPPPLAPAPRMFLLLESGQPFYHGWDTARGRVLQSHGEQVVVHLEQRLLGTIAARGRGELHAGKRE
jgi:hypothetical protein